jgi:pyruvate formate lyase activating enzyme
MLVLPQSGKDVEIKKEKVFLRFPLKTFFFFLKERFGRLEGVVVVTGGEPTIHPDLPEFIKKIKDIGYLVKLDTNGTNPEMLAGLIEAKLIDYIAMDMKAPFAKYSKTVNVNLDWIISKKVLRL